MVIPVPTLSFGTIRRLSLLNIFAFAKIDCRYLDFGASLIAIDRATRIHVAALARTVIAAAHEAIRMHEAVLVRTVIGTGHAGRVHTAANI